MSMNKYMHPRNIYKTAPDFKELALKYPEFKNFVKIEISGKPVFNFKDPEALRALSITLLKRDFNLEVEIPNNKLIPTIPLRLNYILWIEDLLAFIQRSDNVRGIDIGTGSCCVYPLMAVKKNKWSMIATETDKDSIKCAERNIQKNGLKSLIDVVEVTGDTLLTEAVNVKQEYDFCMCNPPFFSSSQELHPFFKSRKQNRPHPKNAFVASINEVVSKGGETEFIQKIINESKILGKKVKIYTSMVGQKSNLPALKKHLREINVHSFKETEFCQGNTTRWGLAWTFLDYDLRKVPNPAKLSAALTSKCQAPLIHEMPNQDSSTENIAKVVDTILSLLRDLKMSFEDVTRDKFHQRFFVTAYSNTWSHQRRKRREKLKTGSQSSEELTGINNNIESNKTELDCPISPGKRSLDDICESTLKKLRLSTDSQNSDNSVVFFKFMFAVCKKDDKINLELNTIDNTSNREYLHQILQYIKNNINDFFKVKQ